MASKISFGNPNHPWATKLVEKFDFGLSAAQEERAVDLHKRLTIFDSLIEVTWYDNFIENVQKGALNSGATGSLTLGAAGLKNWRGKGEEVVADPQYWWKPESMVEDIGLLQQMEREDDKFMICYNAADLRKAKAEKKVGIMINTQNTLLFGNYLERIDQMYRIGLRITQLSYNNQNLVGSGCAEKREAGVSVFGADVIARMNEVGMLVDTGHCMSTTVSDAIDISSKPIACSHAGIRSHTPDVNRTIEDDVLKKLADSGGVFGMVGQPGPISGTDYCDVGQYVDAIDKAVNIMGVDHVGFGLDHYQRTSLKTILTAPEWNPDLAARALGSAEADTDSFVDPSSDGFAGMENNSGYLNLTRGFVKKGYSDEEIVKVMGGNFIRLIEEVIG
ncbi:membrane dipeptidase [Tropicimonas sp. TH_r6]|uniref:dipeptidase n=1 Tax=Tropicimonas sp. TH_r6 TaxID=3082085 RepID=UPI0029549C71|nr:membrane dipeptidase [Tropicimonas sp. TH_r6]MDV7145653.1 membrane dipeptidase [Tropicimonas sp. TH_r6]